MKAFTIIIVLFFISLNVNAQDTFKNESFFNVTQFSIGSLHRADYTQSFSGQITQGTSLNTDNSRVYSLRTVFGYFLNRKWSVGVGVGLDGYHEPNFNTLPLYGDLRYYFLTGKKSVFSYLNYGAVVKIGESFEKGTLLNFGIGYKFFASEDIALLVSISTDYKALSLTNQNFAVSDQSVLISGSKLTLGILF